MPSKQEIRSEETKRSILTAAGQLFAAHGFDAVTMREIAKEAGCSHTTIYIYFKDKEALLHQLSMGPLQSWKRDMEVMLSDITLSPQERFRSMSYKFIEFCLTHQNMFKIFFLERATRVDTAEPTSEINQLRLELFQMLRQSIHHCLEGVPVSDDQVLGYARIYFYTLHGIIGTYTNPDEPLDGLMQRLASTFHLATDVFVAGITRHAHERSGKNES